MTTNIDIKALAQEIAKTYNVSTIIDECEDLIGKCDPDLDEYYIIEEGVEDGFLGFDEWGLDIRVTPEVKYDLMGGYAGCDYCDCDHVVDYIRGIDYVAAYEVCFCDQDGNEYKLTEEQLDELQNELADAMYETK